MRNSLNAVAMVSALAGAGCDNKPDVIDRNSPPEEVIAANIECNDSFETCSADSETQCLLEWGACIQDIRENCAGLSESILNHPNTDTDHDGTPDVAEAEVALTSFCHQDENPLSCANISDDDCDDFNVLGQRHLVSALYRFFTAQNTGNIGE